MPKELSIDPRVMRKRGEITFAPVPVHAYARSLADERARRGDRVLVEVLRHMLIVREFETMLGAERFIAEYGKGEIKREEQAEIDSEFPF